MNNRELLKQARAGFKAIISENKDAVIIFRQPLVDDLFGGLTEDPTGTPVGVVIPCRISHEAKGPQEQQNAPAGTVNNMTRFISVCYNIEINQKETFESIGHLWEIGKVDPLKKFGGVIGYQAPLIERGIITEEDT